MDSRPLAFIPASDIENTKMILALVGAIVLFHLAWFLLSYYQKHRSMPEEGVIDDFQRRQDALLGLSAVSDLLEEQTIEANGIRLHLDILPNGKGFPTVVFIPGTSVYAQVYMKFLHAMSQAGFNVVAFDPRGHGRSSGPRGDYTIDAIVSDAMAVVAYARERFQGQVAVAGSSQGGIAAFYAAARDDALSAAVCHNLADLNGRDNQVLSRTRVPYWLTPVARLLMGVYGGFVIPVAFYLDLKSERLENGQSVHDYIRDDPLCVTWITFRALNSLLRTRLARPVEAIETPVMVIHSDKDHIFPQSYVEAIYSRLTCPRKYLLLRNRGHLVMTNHVQEVVPAVAGWLRETMETFQ